MSQKPLDVIGYHCDRDLVGGGTDGGHHVVEFVAKRGHELFYVVFARRDLFEGAHAVLIGDDSPDL